jgi:hypothetical protein
LLKKSVLDKNTLAHPDVPVSFYGDIVGQALYRPDAVVRGHATKPYYNFLSSFGGGDNATTLLQIRDTGSGMLEVVNFHMLDDRAMQQKTNRN